MNYSSIALEQLNGFINWSRETPEGLTFLAVANFIKKRYMKAGFTYLLRLDELDNGFEVPFSFAFNR